MSNLEPTYLRYIYDGLVKGSIHPENAAELPEGLIGLYEEAFDERSSVVQRQKLLKRFAVWALLKKEVSVAFVAEVLEEAEADIQEFISAYSAWFNSPESGKYQLYHERLKVYLLQKLKTDEIRYFNGKIISLVKSRVFEEDFNEFQIYGLQFLGDHQYIEIFHEKSFDNFISSCLKKEFYDKQFEVSNAFNWSKGPITKALQLASFYNDTDNIFELSKSLVYLSIKEKESLNQINALLDEHKDEIVITRLNSILDGTKDKFITSYIFHVLSILYLVSLKSNETKDDRIKRFIENIEANIPEDQGIINQSLLLPESITILLTIKLVEMDFDPSFMLSRSSNFDFSDKNLNGYSMKEMKLLYNLVKKWFPQKVINFLVSASKSLISQKINPDFFLEKLEIQLENSRDLAEEALLLNTSYDYYSNELIPETILEKTLNRRVINYCCENYLNFETNNLSKKFYSKYFEIDKIKNIHEIFPLPNIDLGKILNESALLLVSEKLSNELNLSDYDSFQMNKRSQIKILLSLIHSHDYLLTFFQNILVQYELEKDLQFFLDVLNPYRSLGIEWQKLKNIHAPNVKDSNITWIENALNSLINSSDLTINECEKTEVELYLSINLFLKVHGESELLPIELYDQIYKSLRKIEDIDRQRNRNYETYYIFQYLVFKGYDLESILRLIKDSNFNGSRLDIYNFLICYHLSHSNIKNAWFIANLLNNLEDQTKCSPLIEILNDLIQVSDLNFQILDEHYDFIINFLKLKKLDSDKERFREFKLMVEMYAMSDEFSNEMIGRIDQLMNEKLTGFVNYSWRILALKYYAERVNLDIQKLINQYNIQSTNVEKVHSDDLNSFKMQIELPRYELFKSKIVKKKVAIHCLKYGLTDYFLSNNLKKENLFSETELLSFTSLYLNKENVSMFLSLVNSFTDAYNKLAFKNELFYFLYKNSLDTSVIKFNPNEERKSHEIAVSAILSVTPNENSIDKLLSCIHELDKIEDDELDFETGEIIDGNEEKVKSLYFIISNLWKMNEGKLANELLIKAFEFCKRMDYDNERRIWQRKLDNLAVLILDNYEFELFINSKLQNNKRLTAEMLDRIFSNNLLSLITKIFDVNKLDRSFIRILVSSYLKNNSIENAFLFAGQINNPSHKRSWKNELLEELYSRGLDFDGKVTFENHFLVFNSAGSVKVLEQMLKYEFFKELNLSNDKEIDFLKYSDYLTQNEVNELRHSFNT